LTSAVETTRASASAAGLYIHIPFCLKKCPYCDFYSITDLSKKEAYLQALMAEIGQRKQPTLQKFDTVYIGGGTPSILSGMEIGKILETARSTFKILPTTEITLEINPGTLNTKALDAYRQAGVTRISVGVQSFNDRILKTLERIHTVDEVTRVLKQVVDGGFNRVSIDLIYGIPGQSMADLRTDLDQATQLGIDHISCYMLSFEPGTEFETRKQAGKIIPVPDTKTAEMFKVVVSTLSNRGYAPYEISNFSRPGCQSRHNVKYWDGISYIGVGAGAHSFNGTTRSWNYRHVEQYIESMADGRLPLSGKEELTRSQHMLEAIYLGLRTTAGIEKAGFERRFNIDFEAVFGDVVFDFKKRGMIDEDERRLALTVDGMLFLDAIIDRMSDMVENDWDG
jgi:oxygen-independent coproporphyrinogen-3 oxidase